MSKSEKKPKDIVFRTGQISGLTLVGYSSLSRYVRDFGEFFSETAKQHERGRRWTQDDLDLVQGIRCLYHQRTGTAKIREMLAGGWRIQNSPVFSRDLESRLIESVLAAAADSSEIAREAIKVIEDNKFASSVSLDDHHQVARNEQRVKELEIRFEEMERHFGLKTTIDKKVATRTRPRIFGKW